MNDGSQHSNQSTWQPDPQNPSTPCVPDIMINAFSALIDPAHATLQVRFSPSGPRLGFS